MNAHHAIAFAGLALESFLNEENFVDILARRFKYMHERESNGTKLEAADLRIKVLEKRVLERT